MFQSISAFITANAVLLGSLLALSAAIVAFQQQRMQFWWCDFWATLPVIGTIARLSKITDKGSNGWMAAEEKLCAIYKPYISLMPESKFNERIEYMRNAGDLGRTPMGVGLKVFLFALVVAESLGFSYLLASWISREGSASEHSLLMYAIVLVLASILAIITHKAGEQRYKTVLLRSCFQRYKDTEGKDYASRSVALMDKQSVDEKEADYTRCINRVAENAHDRGSDTWSWIAGVLIVVIGILAGTMRFYNLEGELVRETVQQSQAASSNPFTDGALPVDVIVPQQEVDKKAQAEMAASTKIEGSSANLMLLAIFIFTQIVGMASGYKHTFGGKETYKKAAGANSSWFWSKMDGAYADTGGFSTYDSYWQTFEPLVDLVNERLKDLQQRLKQHSHENLKLTKTFLNYLEEQQANTNVARANLDRVHVPQSAPVPQEASAPQESVITLDQAKTDYAVLTDKQAKVDYLKNLPIGIQQELRPWIKQRKEEEANKPQINWDDEV